MISNVLNNGLMIDLIKDACLEGLNKRYSNYTRAIVLAVEDDGVVKITTSLPSGNWCNVSVSLRGCDYIYKWLDRVRKEFPSFDDYLCGHYSPDETYYNKIDWKKDRCKSVSLFF